MFSGDHQPISAQGVIENHVSNEKTGRKIDISCILYSVSTPFSVLCDELTFSEAS